MCGKTVEGAKQAGIYMYVKHFICNDGESGMYRDAVYARAVNQDYAQTVDASILKPATIPNFAWWKCVLGAVDVVVVLLFALSVRAVAKDKKRKGENGGI